MEGMCVYIHTLGKYVRALLQIKLVYKYRICIIARALIYRDLRDLSRGCMHGGLIRLAYGMD